MEEQNEEYEVLDSIYGSGDESFKALSPTHFQYKFGTEGDKTSFLLEVKWPEEYPQVLPEFSLDAFYNQHLSATQKASILSLINEESGKNIGEVQTYTMIEWVRDNMETLIEEMSKVSAPAAVVLDDEREKDYSADATYTTAAPKIRKEHLTKNQKKKNWDRVDASGEKPRGHDWVCVMRHLAQTGHGSAE